MLSKEIWDIMNRETQEAIEGDNLLKEILNKSILRHDSFSEALSDLFARKLMGKEFFSYNELLNVCKESLKNNEGMVEQAAKDMLAFYERDPACTRFMEPFLFYKGFAAVQCYRVSRARYLIGQIEFAKFIQMRVSELFSVDLHPQAKIGSGLMIDHAHSIVVGATSVIGDNVSMLHSVTLGGTGKEKGDRHPKIGNGVLLGAGCSILGNISVGYCSKVASGSVVLNDVPPCKTVAGIPAKIVGDSGCDNPSHEMDHSIP